MKKLVFIFFILLFFSKANAQSLAINTDGSTANASSILDVKSTDKGVLIPRLSKIEKNAIATPANGLLIYQNAPDSIGFHFYNGVAWIWLQNTNSAWSLNGNDNIKTTDFLGSINNNALRFRVNNMQSGIIDSSYQNTALGYQSLISTNTNTNNTAIGFDAGKNLTTGYSNTLLGNKALATSNNGYQNVAIGDSAMGNAINSSSNTAVGYAALKNLDGQSGQSFNTAMGYKSQSYPTGTTVGFIANRNTSAGSYAMEKNVTGYDNVAIGYGAMRDVDSSSENVAIGLWALRKNNRTSWTSNVAVGAYTLFSDVDGFWNTAIGGEAMSYALRSNLNTVVGFRTLNSIKDGGENNTLGVGSMEYKDTALSCVAIGRFALSGSSAFNNSPDTGSIAIGTRAGRFNNANYNTFIGYESGIGNPANPLGITGTETVSIGAFSLNKLQSGASNTTFGYAALFNNISGNKNLAIGGFSLYNVNASGNVGIGYDAGHGVTSGSNNIFIGNNSGGLLNVSDKLFIENTNADKDNALIYGDFAADSLTLNAKTVIRDNAVVRGFTKLGGYEAEVPNIKMKTITGITPAVDNFLPFATGIADAKVLSFAVLVEYAGGWKIPPSYRDAAGYEYNVQFQGGSVLIINKLGNSANIGAKPFRVLITYEQ